jgi:hypothetical protein
LPASFPAMKPSSASAGFLFRRPLGPSLQIDFSPIRHSPEESLSFANREALPRCHRGLDRLKLASDPTRDPTRETAEGSILENPRPYRQLSGARDRARTGDPHVGKEMLGLISLSFFAQSGHIDAFWSIVGEAPEAGIASQRSWRCASRTSIARPLANPPCA